MNIRIYKVARLGGEPTYRTSLEAAKMEAAAASRPDVRVNLSAMDVVTHKKMTRVQALAEIVSGRMSGVGAAWTRRLGAFQGGLPVSDDHNPRQAPLPF